MPFTPMATAKPVSSEGVGVADGDAYRGERIGKYEVLTQLSVGGMAELFLCFTSGPGGFRKYVVVKRILPDVKSDEHFVKMFLDEARITAAFNHHNIGQVFDLGEEDGMYLAMEFIAGQNLNQITSAARKQRTAMPLGFSAYVARDTCLALHYAHTFTSPTGRKLPVIHRDVAQKNVMVNYEGVTKLLDFGIAKAKGSLGRTHVGMVKGTTGYMSPEQVQGLTLDGRSDVFSVGVMLFELLTGRRLFAGETEEEEMRKILSAPIPKPRSIDANIPEALSEVVLRALARERADRFGSGKDMAKALEIALGRNLFDAERASGFMRELFHDKMAATRALLESADSDNQASLVKSAVGAHTAADASAPVPPPVTLPPPVEEPARLPPPRKPRAPAPRDANADSDPEKTQLKAPEPPASPPPAAKSSGRPPSSANVPASPVEAWPRLKPEPRSEPKASLPNEPASRALLAPAVPRTSRLDLDILAMRRTPLWVVGLVLGVVVVGIAVFAVVGKAPPPPRPSDGLVEGERTAPRPVGPPPAIPIVRKSSGGGTTTVPGTTQGSVDPSTPERTSRGRGTITLVTKPEAQVFHGRQSLGKTPLFNAPLPAGSQTLRLKGPDGRWRVVTLPVRAGRNAAYRFELTSLPEP